MWIEAAVFQGLKNNTRSSYYIKVTITVVVLFCKTRFLLELLLPYFIARYAGAYQKKELTSFKLEPTGSSEDCFSKTRNNIPIFSYLFRPFTSAGAAIIYQYPWENASDSS